MCVSPILSISICVSPIPFISNVCVSYSLYLSLYVCLLFTPFLSLYANVSYTLCLYLSLPLWLFLLCACLLLTLSLSVSPPFTLSPYLCLPFALSLSVSPPFTLSLYVHVSYWLSLRIIFHVLFTQPSLPATKNGKKQPSLPAPAHAANWRRWWRASGSTKLRSATTGGWGWRRESNA